MDKITIWHNPRCSKSRASLALLEEKFLEIEVVDYLDTLFSQEDIRNILALLGMKSARELMRTKEVVYQELDLELETSEDILINTMIANPKLIERPIIIKGDHAVIGRPIENVITLLG